MIASTWPLARIEAFFRPSSATRDDEDLHVDYMLQRRENLKFRHAQHKVSSFTANEKIKFNCSRITSTRSLPTQLLRNSNLL